MTRTAHIPSEPMRLQVALPRSLVLPGSPRISPDGRFIAFDGADSTGRTLIWLRRLNSLTAEPIPSTEGATARPFWSPDSRYIAFTAGGKLKKVSVDGGPAQTIADAPSGWDGSWSRDGVIAFDGAGGDPIRRVSASGGVVTTLVAGDSGSVGWPEFLPDGRHLLYLVIKNSGVNEMWVADTRTGKRRMLGVGGSRAVYSAAGYLLYVKDRTLLAQPFDAGALRLTGEPAPVVDGVGMGGNGLAHFSVSSTGTIAYSSSGLAGNSQLQWMDRGGKVLSTVGPACDITNISLAPDGKRVVARILDPQTANRDIWVLDPDRGTNTRFTFDAANENAPLWSPDGGMIAFSSDRKGGIGNLYQKRSSGTGAEESLFVSSAGKSATDWSRDGRFIAFNENNATTNSDLWVLPLSGDRKPIPFLQTSFIEGQGRFSPDGRWLAYTSDESGRFEIYVQSFPGPGGKWQISTRGGYQPTWRADGRELYYLATDGSLMAVPISATGDFAAGVPVTLFNTRISLSNAISQYAPSKDGQRFLVVAQERASADAPLTVVLNWNAGMKRR